MPAASPAFSFVSRPAMSLRAAGGCRIAPPSSRHSRFWPTAGAGTFSFDAGAVRRPATRSLGETQAFVRRRELQDGRFAMDGRFVAAAASGHPPALGAGRLSRAFRRFRGVLRTAADRTMRGGGEDGAIEFGRRRLSPRMRTPMRVSSAGDRVSGVSDGFMTHSSRSRPPGRCAASPPA